jgi:hypothetical protein
MRLPARLIFSASPKRCHGLDETTMTELNRKLLQYKPVCRIIGKPPRSANPHARLTPDLITHVPLTPDLIAHAPLTQGFRVSKSPTMKCSRVAIFPWGADIRTKQFQKTSRQRARRAAEGHRENNVSGEAAEAQSARRRRPVPGRCRERQGGEVQDLTAPSKWSETYSPIALPRWDWK